MIRVALSSDRNIMCADLLTWRQRWARRMRRLTEDMTEAALTLVGTAGICLACYALAIAFGWAR
jgi:hypothetical protein